MRACLLRGVVLVSALAVFGQADAQVVISQVYGGGGNSGATLRSDFVELHNNGTNAVSLSGWSVQYASSTGSTWQVTPLSGSIAPGAYYLIKQADGAGGTVDLPTPDATGTIAMAAGAGKVALSNGTASLSGTCPTGNIDFVGFGGAANCAEGGAPTATLNNTTAALRNDGGCTDSDNNGTDFSTGAPAPRNSASTVNVCGGAGQPVATMAAVSLAEGDAGTTTFTFTLSLNEPAAAGGVSFDIATADGTATAADNDYIPASAPGQIIAEGEQSYVFDVLVNGDTRSEPNETFLIEVSNITGALPGSLQAVGTIVNDDIVATPIHVIQGSGNVSPLVGQNVYTTGIVTARRNNGFFLQTPDAEADADPATSQGIFVFTNSAPPAAAAVGNRVQVQGTVVEYVPSADPYQPPLTEIGGAVLVTQLSTGNPLPTPVVLTATFPDPAGPYDQLERLEGMRVTVPSLTVSGPTLGNVSEVNATATSIGVFHAVVTGVPRPFREPGIQAPDPAPNGAPLGNIPRWDTNPELFAVDSDGLGGAIANVAAGCVTTAAATGPMDYSFRRYTLYPETSLAFDCSAAAAPSPALAPQADDVSVATYNMQRFFDDTNDPAVGEPVLSSVAYQARLNKASLAIRDYLNAPDIIGVVEMENLATLQALASRIGSDAVAAGQNDPHYASYLLEGNDVGGIDVGFLVKTAEVGAGIARVEVVSVVQEGKATTWTEPGGGVSLLNDRPPLVLQAVVHFNDGRQLPLTAIVVHQRSLNGADDDGAGGDRVRAKRQAQAEFLANLIQARQLANPAEQLLVMGDFNAFEFNDGYVDAMNVVTGTPSPDDETAVPGDGADLVDPDLYNLTLLHTQDQSYSYVFDGQIQSLDHILVNQALFASPELEALEISHARINADFPETARNDAGTPTRLSDHDPAVVLLRLKALQFADLGVAANASPDSVVPGQTANFSVVVSNDGPDAAAFAAVAFVFDKAVAPSVTPAAGWTCTPPQTTSTTTITCGIASFAAGGVQTFVLGVVADASLVGTTLQLAAAASSQTADPALQDNNDVAAVTVSAPAAADLALQFSGPAAVPAKTFSIPYTATLSNLGSLPAQQPVVVFSGNTMTATASVSAPSGWQCGKQGRGRAVTFRCTTGSLAAGASVDFGIKVTARPTPANRIVQVDATATSATPDADPANDSATIATSVLR